MTFLTIPQRTVNISSSSNTSNVIATLTAPAFNVNVTSNVANNTQTYSITSVNSPVYYTIANANITIPSVNVTTTFNAASNSYSFTINSVGNVFPTFNISNVSSNTTNATPFRRLGAGLGGLDSSSFKLPFINLMKTAGGGGTSGYSLTANGKIVGLWQTSSDSIYNSNEAYYLNLDANGYPISLNVTNTPNGYSQQFTYLQMPVLINLPSGINAAPNVVSPYPAGLYHLTFDGQGTLALNGDASNLVCTGNGTVNGTGFGNMSVASTGNGHCTCTFTITPTTGGFTLFLRQLPNPNNHISNISIYSDQFNSIYANGAIFNPYYVQALQNFSVLRFMDWMQTAGGYGGDGMGSQAYKVTLSAPWNAGNTSGNITSPWLLPTGYYPLQNYVNGGTINVFCTANSTAVTFPALNTTFGSGNSFLFSHNTNWQQRTPSSFLTYNTLGGVPIEVCCLLANQANTNAWINIPMAVNNSYITNAATLIANTLNNIAYIEFSNEVWNSTAVAGEMGNYNAVLTFGTYPAPYGNRLNWYGGAVAQTAQLIYNAVGPTIYANKFIVSMGFQGGGTGTITNNMTSFNAPLWVALSSGRVSPLNQSPARITAYHAGAYICQGINAAVAADVNTMCTQADGGITDFFAEQYNNTGKYSSTPVGGWMQQQFNYTAQTASYMNTNYGSYNLKFLGYECDNGWGTYGYAGWTGNTAQSLLLQVYTPRDPRMQNLMRYYFNGLLAAGMYQPNIFVEMATVTNAFGTYIALESVQQLSDANNNFVPLSSLPPAWQGVQQTILGT